MLPPFLPSFCFSKEEFQQRHHPRDPWSERRRWRRADGNQSVSQMSDHIQTNPAASQRSRLQTHTGGLSHTHSHACIHANEFSHSDVLICSVSTWSPICSLIVREEPGDVQCASTCYIDVSLHILESDLFQPET